MPENSTRAEEKAPVLSLVMGNEQMILLNPHGEWERVMRKLS